MHQFDQRARRRGPQSRLWKPLAAALTLVGLLLTLPGTAHAIANADPVPEGQYRFSVLLTMTGIPTADGGTRNSNCSGVLIAPTWVMSARHCNRDEYGIPRDGVVANLVTATVGRADLTGENGDVVRVVDVRMSGSTDISLFKLERPVRDRILPLALATHPPKEGQILRVTGYGADNSVNPTVSDVLRTGQVSVVSVNDATIGVTGHAPAPDTSACPYDSGAPYFIERRNRPPLLVSVESDGPGCPHSGVETTARVDNIVPWILRVISEKG
jgi:secreted trypsin-like serine protease